MPKGNCFERAFRLKSLLSQAEGVIVPEIMREFDIKKQSAQAMTDKMSLLFCVYEMGFRHRRQRPPAIIYGVKK